MPSPFAGMDPWLRADLWPDLHNRLIAAIGDVLGPRVRPRYFVALEEVEVELPIADRRRETYLEIRSAGDGEVVAVLEVLSPVNKRAGEGRRVYLQKRSAVLATLTNLVEIDLLRGGEPMPVVGNPPSSDYAILVSRSWQRPRAHLLPFDLRDPIPPVPAPLRSGEEEPVVDLGAALGALYDRASYDLRVDYQRPPEPPLAAGDVAWAEARLAGRSG